MANIRVDINETIKDGSEIVFRSPADCSAITGLIVYYVAEDGAAASKEFVLSDAHGHNVGDIDHLFAENVVVKVILDVTHGMAYVQNADTNAYIERTFIKSVNGVTPDENGNVDVTGGTVTDEKIGKAVDKYLEENPVVGAQGPKGDPGEKGDKGDKGDTGATGPQGPKGDTGASGSQGPKGDKGDTGPQGPAGADGAKGDKGDKGDTGATGPQGQQGEQGIQGPKGDTGATGPAGPQGDSIKGDTGSRGTGILKVSTTPSSYTTETGGQNPTKRMKLDTIKSEASVSEVLPGDVISHSYYLYPIYYVDSTYAYTKSGTSIRGASGSAGAAGANGVDGKDGVDGKTPEKGVDYWTVADQESIVQQVIAALGTPVFGRVDIGNNIILTGELADGTYTIKYEDGEGNQTTIGTLTAEGEPTYTNLIPLSINSDKTLYHNGQGWKTGYRLNTSGTETAQSGIEVTGFMPVTRAATIYLSGVMNPYNGANKDYHYLSLYDGNFAKIISPKMDSNISAYGGVKYDAENNMIEINVEQLLTYYSVDSAKRDMLAYFRLSATEITNDSIITVNQPIA